MQQARCSGARRLFVSKLLSRRPWQSRQRKRSELGKWKLNERRAPKLQALQSSLRRTERSGLDGVLQVLLCDWRYLRDLGPAARSRDTRRPSPRSRRRHRRTRKKPRCPRTHRSRERRPCSIFVRPLQTTAFLSLDSFPRPS